MDITILNDDMDSIPDIPEHSKIINNEHASVICKGIDRDFFNDAFKQLQSRLFGYATHFVGKDVAEDIVSEIFYYWWKSNKHFDNMDHVSSYLFVAVRHACFRWLQLQKRESGMLSHLRNYTIEEDFTVKEALLQRLESEIALLPPQCQRIFRLAHLDKIPEKEIAKLLRLSPNTVRNQKARAIQLLRLALKDTFALLLLEAILWKS